MPNNRLRRIFFDVDFRCRHEGLHKLLKKNGTPANDLDPDDMIIFINARRTRVMALKMMPEGNSWGVLGYYRSPKESPIDYRAMKYIPQSFGGGPINMTEAIKLMLEKELPLIAKKE